MNTEIGIDGRKGVWGVGKIIFYELRCVLRKCELRSNVSLRLKSTVSEIRVGVF